MITSDGLLDWTNAPSKLCAFARARTSYEISENIFLSSFITQSVHYKTVSTIYVAEPKILRYSVHFLQNNIPMNIRQSHVRISSSSSSIGTVTLVGFGLLNYRRVFSAGSFLPSAIANGTSNPQLGGPVI